MVLGLISIHYFVEPSDYKILIPAYLSLFIPYYILSTRTNLNPVLIIAIGIGLRLLLLGPPTLSDDSYRYYWDGTLLANGQNPYQSKPIEINGSTPYFNKEKTGVDVYENLNSKDYYSVYPPVLQGVFAFSAWAGRSYSGFLLVLKLLIITAELIIGFTLLKVLKTKGLPKNRISLYLLNPLIIIELSGNLHGEIFMLLFISLSLSFFYKQNHLLVGVFLALAFLTKLYPILFLPIFLLPFKFKEASITSIAFITTTLLVSIPLIGLIELSNINESVSLYFEKFEFNGGIYQALRWIGIKLTGYNQIAIIGKLLSVVFLGFTSYVYYLKIKHNKRLSVETAIFCIIMAFYIFSTTIMPWYLSLSVLLSTFTKQKSALLWSALIVLSYSAFANASFNENPFLVAIEYSVLFIFILYEIKAVKTKTHFELNK